jgi:hypothetical protein
MESSQFLDNILLASNFLENNNHFIFQGVNRIKGFIAEVFFTYMFPKMLSRVKFWATGREIEEANIIDGWEFFGSMPSGTINKDNVFEVAVLQRGKMRE